MKKCLLSLIVLVAISSTTQAEQVADSTNAGQQKPAELDRPSRSQ